MPLLQYSHLQKMSNILQLKNIKKKIFECQREISLKPKLTTTHNQLTQLGSLSAAFQLHLTFSQACLNPSTQRPHVFQTLGATLILCLLGKKT